MHRNLIYGSLFMNVGLKVCFDYDRLILTHIGKSVEKAFCNGRLFIQDAFVENMNKMASTSSAYITEFI